MQLSRKSFRNLLLGCLIVFLLGTSSQTLSAASTNYWTNKEVFQIKYEGYIQFNPSKANDTNLRGLKKSQHVSQAYINYSRNGKSVIGGRKYTAKGSLHQNKIFSASATAWDTLNPFADKTMFNYGWTQGYIIA